MSTNALIVYKNNSGISNCISVHWDGYIKNGVGELLHTHWQNPIDISKLCSLKKEIREFGSSMNNIEFYESDPYMNKRTKKLKNLTFEMVENYSGNYDYTYVWDESNPGWKVFDGRALNRIEEFLN